MKSTSRGPADGTFSTSRIAATTTIQVMLMMPIVHVEAEVAVGRWDAALIAEGQAIVRRCLRRRQPGPYQLQAAIQAVHSDAPTADATDWKQVVALVDTLDLSDHHRYHAVRADLLRRLGRRAEAERAYRRAIADAANDVERRFLHRRLGAVEADRERRRPPATG